MSTLVVGSLFLGWIIGGIGNWAADQLPHTDRASRPAPWVQPRHYWGWPTLSPQHAQPGHAADQPIAQPANRSQPHRYRTPLLLVAMALCYAYTAYRMAPAQTLTEQPYQWAALLLAWGYIFFLLVVLVIDLEHRRVLNSMLMPVGVVALAGSLLPTTPSPLGTLLGGAVGFGLFLLVYIIGRGRMGAGDVKLAGIIGLMVGHPAVWTALVIGVVLGGIAAIILLASRRAGRHSTMAYAPYLAIGALIALWQTWGIAAGL